MDKVVSLIKFLSNKGFKKESSTLYSAYNKIFEEEEGPSSIEELCNKDIRVTINIEKSLLSLTSENDCKYNWYRASVDNPFFKNMKISFSDEYLRYLDEKNYFTLDAPSFDSEKNYDEFEIKYKAYEKREVFFCSYGWIWIL